MQIEDPAAGPQVDLSNCLYAFALNTWGRTERFFFKERSLQRRRPITSFCLESRRREECVEESVAFAGCFGQVRCTGEAQV